MATVSFFDNVGFDFVVSLPVSLKLLIRYRIQANRTSFTSSLEAFERIDVARKQRRRG